MTKRQKRVNVSLELLGSMFVNGTENTTTNMPDDATLERVFPAETGETIVFIFSSNEWESLREGEIVPEFDLKIERADE